MIEDESCITAPAFVRLWGGRWTLPEGLTVAKWREAKWVARRCDNGHSRCQFKFATALLEQAEDHGVPEDVRLLPWLVEHGHLKREPGRLP